MPRDEETPVEKRIRKQQMQPRISALWQALQPLRTTLSFMNSGAHPDDETSAMLAALGLRDGVHLSYVCANRGEGGQNDLGTENGATLGALRTAEMEQAAERLSMRLYWLSETPDDTISDFGFSKSGEETLRHWGDARTLKRMVDVVRRERPDILCPTFLDVPGQHGHHRAMTRIAQQIMSLSAKADYPESDLPPWQVKKLLLPAWGGGGDAYDDEVPPPMTTHVINAKGRDPVTGWSYEQIAQQSRVFHKTQGMGRWISPGDERDWPLHLLDSRVSDQTGSEGETLGAGIAARLSELAALPGAEPISQLLRDAEDCCGGAIAAFPEGKSVCDAAVKALGFLRLCRDECPDTLQDQILHRIDRMENSLSRVIWLASGAEASAIADQTWLTPGETADLSIETREGRTGNLTVTPQLPGGWVCDGTRIGPGPDAMPHDGYRASYDPLKPPTPALRVSFDILGTPVSVQLPINNPPVALPPRSATLVPEGAIINTATLSREIKTSLSGITPAGAVASLSPPEGWEIGVEGAGFAVAAPVDATPGLYDLPLTLDNAPARSVQRISYAHINATALTQEENLKIRVLNAEIPSVRVGYIGGGNDNVDAWLSAMGVQVEQVSDGDLQVPGALLRFDTIVIGIFALGFRTGLQDIMPELHAWMRDGGTLITLYHRPRDNWDPDSSAPAHLEIGQPSLRWRVTDKNAAVKHLAPDHPLLNTPNKITDDDWADWHKERGLYFAKSWGPEYTPLLEMSDPGETPHQGALLVGDIGDGRHIHCALILHHQMEQLTPGAFRLMANLLAKRSDGA
ncbi:PIG-L family deacetylase [Halocynthiibacter sp.]|uniref:PIG-L family deacetylase n=1 Tax=Halocynthiibacter sp. TaxID=1979210 RepID=UPI003C3E3C14